MFFVCAGGVCRWVLGIGHWVLARPGKEVRFGSARFPRAASARAPKGRARLAGCDDLVPHNLERKIEKIVLPFIVLLKPKTH